jgi:hypothetical protein
LLNQHVAVVSKPPLHLVDRKAKRKQVAGHQLIAMFSAQSRRVVDEVSFRVIDTLGQGCDRR